MSENKVEVSINGLRMSLSDAAQELKNAIEETDHSNLEQKIIDSANRVFEEINFFNCMYVKGDENFRDLGHIEIDLIE